MRILRKCEVCGEEFIATKITNKYCSKRCARVVHRKKEAEKKKKARVCARTVQMDIQIMRSDKLGYNAPIEVYDRIYYRYADPDYSITEMPLSIEDCKLIKKAIILLENKKDKNNEDTIQVLNKVQDRLKSILNFV